MKNNIIIINPGPVYHAETPAFQEKYNGLSRYFEGYVFTTANNKRRINMENFVFLSSDRKKNAFLSLLKFVFFCISTAIKLKNDKEKIDLVVTYDPIKTGFIGWIISCILSAKLIVEVNGVYACEAEWLDVKNPIVRLIKKKVFLGLIRFNLKRADGIKLLFENQIDFFMEEQIADKLAFVYPEYVPTALFKPLREKKEILFAGFPFKRKGVDILIDAFKSIASDYPDWQLVILGWYPETEELYSAIGGHEQIEHLKPVTYDKMPEHIGSCGILVLPSRSEAMGRVLVEAMAAGKPRIGSLVDGIPTVINHDVDGLLVEPGNVNLLANALRSLMDDKNLRQIMGQAGIKRAKQEFTISNYVENCHNFYSVVIGNVEEK